MADTAEGRRLTEAHRVAQVELSGQAVAASRLLWGELNPADLAHTRGPWRALQVALLRSFDQRSAGLAVDYLGRYRAVEDHPGPVDGVNAFNAEWAGASVDAVPARIAQRLGEGAKPGEAKAATLGILLGDAMRFALQGGRRVVDRSTLANPRSVGWRRVADGNPCGFCAMTASRGPAYRSESSAKGGRKFHRACGCTAEEVFGTWTPTAREQRFIDAYDTAAENVIGARTQQTVLPELRKLGYR
jgi:hypothetical protein